MLDPKRCDVLQTGPIAVEMPSNFHEFRKSFDAAVESGDEVTMLAYSQVLPMLEERAFVTDEDVEAAGKFTVFCLLQDLMGDTQMPRGAELRTLKVKYAGMFHRLELMEANAWAGNN